MSLPSSPTQRARGALAAGLFALAGARFVLPWVPGAWVWSLDLLRYLTPVTAWLPWVFAAVIVAFARRATWPVRVGNWIERHAWAPVSAALVLATLVFGLPDETHMTGDFILRRQAIEENRTPETVFPQAMPLDVWLHYTLPRALFTQAHVRANLEARVWGALDAAAIGWLAVAFARAFSFSGTAALAVAASVAFGGWLALFTGDGKGLAELVVLALAIATWGADVVARNRGHVRLGLAAALAIAIHRAGVVLVPAAWVACAIALVRHGPSSRRIVAIALPGVALAVFGPRAFGIARAFDVETHLAGGGDSLRLWDLLNVLVLNAPLVLCLPLLAAAFGAGIPRRAAALPLAVLAASLVALAFAVHPQQGLVRDWDVFAPAGMALAALTAWLVGEALRQAPATPAAPARAERKKVSAKSIAPTRANTSANAMLAVAAAMLAIVPAVQWLLHLHDVRHGLARIEAIATGPPKRSEVERARLWDYVGVRRAWLDDWPGAARAFSQSAALLPTPRVLDQWGRAEMRIENWEGARGVYRTMIARNPDDVTGWRGYTTAVTRLDNRDSARVGAEGILRLDPNDREAREILEFLDREPGR